MSQQITDQEINRQRAEVAAGISLAEAQRNARAHRDGASPADGAHLRNAGPPVHSPHSLLQLAIEPQLGQWDRVVQHPMAGRPDGEHFLPKALAACELLRRLLAKLDGKAGERAVSTRASLQSQLVTIEKAIDHFRSLGPALDGALAQELERRIVECRAAQQAAQNAKHVATSREAVREALLDIEVAESQVRAADRAVAEAVAGLRTPPLPDVQAVRDAECATHDLERLPKKPTAAHVRKAIEEGERGGAQAQFWICFESGSHELLTWRWRGHTGQ